MRRKFLLLGSLIALSAFSLHGLVTSAAEVERSSESISAELPRLDDYADQTYLINVYRDLEKRIPKEADFAKEWAVAKFVVDRSGKVEKAEIENSTGNEKFNLEALKILHETRLPPLPEDCPDKVRATHAFNYRRAVKTIPTARTTESGDTAKQLLNGFGSRQSEHTSVPTNGEAVKNVAANSMLLVFYAIFIMMFMGGGSIFAFFIALPVWYLHRLFFGRFPA